MILARETPISTSPLTVLVFAPTGQDAYLLSNVLADDGVHCEVFQSMQAMTSRMTGDFGAILVAEEALDRSSMALLRERLEMQEPWSDIPLIVMTTGGETTLASLRISREFNPAGNVTLLERPFRPITVTSSVQVALRARKKQFQVRELLDKHREATQMRDEFISIASHELKTPLTSLKLQTQLNELIMKRENGELSAVQVHRLVETTNRQVDRLSRLVEDMLDVSRINTGQLALEKSEVDLFELISEVAERLAPQLASVGCKVSIAFTSQVRGLWDRYRLEQVFTNLFTNAIRYAAGTAITFDASVTADGSMAHISMSDGGPGISPENRERVFGRFERIHSAGGIDGLGLGLYICRQIVESHGGQISVSESSTGGAKFVIELPLGLHRFH